MLLGSLSDGANYAKFGSVGVGSETMTCADCGKPLEDCACETDNPRPGRITVLYQRDLCEKCYEKRVKK